jgi:Cu+-exporting ATPase
VLSTASRRCGTCLAAGGIAMQAHMHRFMRAIIEQNRENSMPEFTLRIDNMHCGSCVRRVSRALAATEGLQVNEVRVGAARVSSSKDPAPVEQAVAALEKAGYPARLEE